MNTISKKFRNTISHNESVPTAGSTDKITVWVNAITSWVGNFTTMASDIWGKPDTTVTSVPVNPVNTANTTDSNVGLFVGIGAGTLVVLILIVLLLKK